MKDSVKITYSENLRALIESDPRLTQVEFAQKMGVTNTSVQRWLNAESLPKSEQLEHIAIFFNLEVSYFFTKNPTKSTPVKSDPSKALLDKLAQRCLNESEMITYRKEGVEEFFRVIEINYETDRVLIVPWINKLQKELNEYTSLDLQKKIDQITAQPNVTKVSTSKD